MRKGLCVLMLALFSAGCVDFSKANWFGCQKGERLEQTQRSMFGAVKYPARCVGPDSPIYQYLEPNE